MAYATGLSTINNFDLYSSTASPAAGIYPGQIVWDNKTGKAFRYSLAGGSLVVGNLLQTSVNDTTYANMTVAAASAAGATTLSITNGTATITSAQFAGGSLTIYTAGTIGVADEYTILGVTGTLTTGGALTVTIDRPLRAAVSTSATVNMKRSPWSGVIQFPASTQTGIPAGVAIYPIASGEYGWIQTHGICGVLSDGSTNAVGSDVGTPSGTAGAVTVYAAGTTHARVGVTQQVLVSGKGISVFLQID